jgi:hypothetical protein
MEKVSLSAIVSLLPSWLRGDDGCNRINKRTLALLSPRSGNNPLENLLLERFLSDQRELLVKGRQYAALRSDLKSLRRVGNPLSSPTISCVSGGSFASSALTNQVAEPMEAVGSEHSENMYSKSTLLEIPGLSFADYIWALSASRKMRIEAIYI